MKPFYQDDHVTLYNCDIREVLPDLPGVDLVLTDPPYPNNAGHFLDGIGAAIEFFYKYECGEWLVFWDEIYPPLFDSRLLGVMFGIGQTLTGLTTTRRFITIANLGEGLAAESFLTR